MPTSSTPTMDDYANLYNGVTQSVRSTIDTAAGGTLMNKMEDEAYNLIEEMTLSNYLWSNKKG